MATDILIRVLLDLGPSDGGIEMGCEERLQIARRWTILDIREELELSLDTSRTEDSKRLALALPRFERGYHIIE